MKIDYRKFGSGQSQLECENLHKMVLLSNNIDGDMAEVGVYEGGSAKLINEYKSPNKKLYLFDTFDGWMDCDLNEDGPYILNGGCVFGSIEYVKSLFTDDSNVEVIKGYFPDTAPSNFSNKMFSLIHIDTDTYMSTKKSLEYFYDKISVGGVIIHDYNNSTLLPDGKTFSNITPGVKKAVDEFLSNKSENVIITYNSQCMFIKL